MRGSSERDEGPLRCNATMARTLSLVKRCLVDYHVGKVVFGLVCSLFGPQYSLAGRQEDETYVLTFPPQHDMPVWQRLKAKRKDSPDLLSCTCIIVDELDKEMDAFYLAIAEGKVYRVYESSEMNLDDLSDVDDIELPDIGGLSKLNRSELMSAKAGVILTNKFMDTRASSLLPPSKRVLPQFENHVQSMFESKNIFPRDITKRLLPSVPEDACLDRIVRMLELTDETEQRRQGMILQPGQSAQLRYEIKMHSLWLQLVRYESRLLDEKKTLHKKSKEMSRLVGHDKTLIMALYGEIQEAARTMKTRRYKLLLQRLARMALADDLFEYEKFTNDEREAAVTCDLAAIDENLEALEDMRGRVISKSMINKAIELVSGKRLCFVQWLTFNNPLRVYWIQKTLAQPCKDILNVRFSRPVETGLNTPYDECEYLMSTISRDGILISLICKYGEDMIPRKSLFIVNVFSGFSKEVDVLSVTDFCGLYEEGNVLILGGLGLDYLYSLLLPDISSDNYIDEARMIFYMGLPEVETIPNLDIRENMGYIFYIDPTSRLIQANLQDKTWDVLLKYTSIQYFPSIPGVRLSNALVVGFDDRKVMTKVKKENQFIQTRIPGEIPSLLLQTGNELHISETAYLVDESLLFLKDKFTDISNIIVFSSTRNIIRVFCDIFLAFAEDTHSWVAIRIQPIKNMN